MDKKDELYKNGSIPHKYKDFFNNDDDYEITISKDGKIELSAGLLKSINNPNYGSVSRTNKYGKNGEILGTTSVQTTIKKISYEEFKEKFIKR